jgi:hypothetical protein
MLESPMKRRLNMEIIAPLAPSLAPPSGERVFGRTGEGIISGFSRLFLSGIVEDGEQ